MVKLRESLLTTFSYSRWAEGSPPKKSPAFSSTLIICSMSTKHSSLARLFQTFTRDMQSLDSVKEHGCPFRSMKPPLPWHDDSRNKANASASRSQSSLPMVWALSWEERQVFLSIKRLPHIR